MLYIANAQKNTEEYRQQHITGSFRGVCYSGRDEKKKWEREEKQIHSIGLL